MKDIIFEEVSRRKHLTPTRHFALAPTQPTKKCLDVSLLLRNKLLSLP